MHKKGTCIPLHPHFGHWAGWGQRLLALHIGYEGVEPWPVTRRDTPDERARAAGLSPKVILKSDPSAGTVTLDSETVPLGIPKEAWIPTSIAPAKARKTPDVTIAQ